MAKQGKVWQAAYSGDKEALQKALNSTWFSSGGDINELGAGQTTPLMAAIMNKHYQIADSIIDMGAHINAANKNGESALHLLVSCAPSSFNLMQKLVEKGADVNQVNNDGISVLQQLLLNKDIIQVTKEKMMRYLITHGADTDVKDSDGDTLFIYALAIENESFARFLMQKGVDIKTPDCESQTTPLMWAIINNMNDLVKDLIDKGAPLNDVDSNGETALMFAVDNDNLEIIKLLVSRGANVNTIDKEDDSPLSLAVGLDKIKVVELLIQAGANVHKKNEYGQSLLVHAIENKNQKMLKLLIDNGVDVNATDQEGQTPFMYATMNNDPTSMLYLASRNADIDMQDNEGNTAYIFAAHDGHMNALKMLRQLDADISIENHQGYCPMLIAALEQKMDVMTYLMKSGLLQYVHKGNLEERARLVQQQMEEQTVGQLIDLQKSNPILWHKIVSNGKLPDFFRLLPAVEHSKMYKRVQKIVGADEKLKIQQVIRNARERAGN